uniref:Uncharacterized protein n=1 Tax=Arundo donax TaxID=35708 RepID=A0A0A9FUE2_ARUDO
MGWVFRLYRGVSDTKLASGCSICSLLPCCVVWCVMFAYLLGRLHHDKQCFLSHFLPWSRHMMQSLSICHFVPTIYA